MFNLILLGIGILAGLCTGIFTALSLMEFRWLPLIAYILSAVGGFVCFIYYAVAFWGWK